MACRIPEHVDLAIAGAGPVGATLALLAAQAGRKVALIEARPALAGTTGKDPRVLALSWGSQQLLQRVGAWPADLPATPIDSVHVSQHSGLGRVLIQRQDLDLPHLGFTVGYAALNDALAAALAASSVCVLTDTTVTAVTSLGAYARVRCCQAGQAGELTARVLALAEGGALADTLPDMTRREYDYQQRALIARIDTDTPHQGRAFERFAAEGPLALLPNGDSYTLVWTRPHAEAEALLGDQHIRYIKLFRAQLSRSELIIMGFNLWLNDESQNMLPLAEKYGLLKHLPTGPLRTELEKLHPQVFGHTRAHSLQALPPTQPEASL